MSTHSIPVIKIGALRAHPNADALDLIDIDGYTCVVRKGSFAEGDLAVYIEPDYLVPLDRPEFEFLRPPNKPDRMQARIGVKRLRGIYSMGLLIPAPAGAQAGDDMLEALGIERYEPAVADSVALGGQTEAPPYKVVIPVYDLENVRRYPSKLVGRDVVITEKIHGTNARYVWQSAEQRIYCGSRREWKREGDNAYWRVLREQPWIEQWCRTFPDTILWGEIFGWVQDLRYGAQPGQLSFRAFDAYEVLTGNYWPRWALASSLASQRLVPLLYAGQCPSLLDLEIMADDDSAIADHMREGVVIEVVDQAGWDADLQAWRIKLKLPGRRYLSR